MPEDKSNWCVVAIVFCTRPYSLVGCSEVHGVMSDKAVKFVLNHSENIGSHDINTSDSMKY